MFKGRKALGIEVSNGKINLALLCRSGGELKLRKAASGAIPEGAVVDGRIKEPVLLARAIRKLQKKNGMRAFQAAMSLVAEPVLTAVVPYSLLTDALNNTEASVESVGRLMADGQTGADVQGMEDPAIDFCALEPGAGGQDSRVFVAAADNDAAAHTSLALGKMDLDFGVEAAEPAVASYVRACWEKKVKRQVGSNVVLCLIEGETVYYCVFTQGRLAAVKTRKVVLDVCRLCPLVSEQVTGAVAGEISQLIESFGGAGEGRPDWKVTVVAPLCENLAPGKAESIKARLPQAQVEVISLQAAWACSPVTLCRGVETPSVVAIGLAMRLLDAECGLELNLLPETVARARIAKRHALWVANAAAVIMLIMILGVGFLQVKARRVTENTGLVTARPLLGALGSNLQRRQFLSEQISQVQSRLESLDSASRTGAVVEWGKVFDDLATLTPKAVRIVRLSSVKNSEVLIEGKALSHEAVQLFVEMLGTSRYIENTSLLGSHRDESDIDWVQYAIRCSMAR